MKKCSELMTKSLVCCLASEPVSKVAQMMKDNDIGAIPVVDGQQHKHPIGMVTDRDIALGVVALGRDPLITTAEAVMTRAVVTCHDDEDILDILEAMSVYQVRRIPVVDRNNSLVGIISLADIALRLDQPKRIAEMIREVSVSNSMILER